MKIGSIQMKGDFQMTKFDLHEVTRLSIWNKIHLHCGDYFGVDEKGNLCFTRLQLEGDNVKITSKINGIWVDRFISIHNPALPIDIQQILYVNRYMRKNIAGVTRHQHKRKRN